jgi:hypothetical protein
MNDCIESRVPADVYRARRAINISSLKEMRRSPAHYRYLRDNPEESTPAMALGTAAHCATLEPERFESDYVVWNRKTESGRAAPRNGKAWEAFQAEAGARAILNADEAATAKAIAAAVRGDPVAAKYLESGEPEVVLKWEISGRACKGRVDWLTHMDDRPVIVGLKTARDCRPFIFGSVAAKLGYAEQWAFYYGGYLLITGHSAKMVEIVVESEPPHVVVVYEIPDDIIMQGEENYLELMRALEICERDDHWPGPAEVEQILTLPSWFYGAADDDLTELQLET